MRKCENRNCCGPPRAPDTFEFLSLNNGFLPPVVQGRDKHFLILLHTLEYFNNDQLPGYDKHCSSILPELYNELICQKCGKYFPTKLFIKNHIKTMHPSGRKRVAQVMQEIENDNMNPEENQGSVVKESVDDSHKEGDIMAIDSTKHGMQFNKQRSRDNNRRRKGSTKNSHP